LQKVYVGNSLGNDISVIDLKTMKVTGGIVLGDHPHGVTAQPDGRRLFATVESDHTLRIIDTSTDKITDSIPLTGKPNQPAVTPNGKFVAVPIRDGDSVDIVDVAQKKVVKVLTVKVPHNCYNAGSNRHMFCTSMDDELVHLIDLGTMSTTARIPAGGIPRPLAVSKDEKTLFVAVSDLHGFVVVDIPSGKVVRKVEFPPEPPGAFPLEPNTPTHGLAISPDGKELWAAGMVDDGVFVYNIASRQVSKKLPTGAAPNWVAFSPDGKYAVVSNAGSNDCSIFDTATRQEVARVKVGKAPKRLFVVSAPTL
jgi:YVTN family beta-propeller protein